VHIKQGVDLFALFHNRGPGR